jgi:Fur family ferric uptake transcriptional regulator
MNKEAHPLKDFLGPGGLKNTRERETILRELEVRKGHFNAEELYSVLNRKGTKVSRPTIYRTLKLLEKYHLIDRLDIKQNCFYYESIFQKKDHGHMICERCGKIVDFSSESLNTLKSEMGKDKNFKLDNISIQVFGLCKSCQKASRNKN